MKEDESRTQKVNSSGDGLIKTGAPHKLWRDRHRTGQDRTGRIYERNDNDKKQGVENTEESIVVTARVSEMTLNSPTGVTSGTVPSERSLLLARAARLAC